MGCCNPRQIFPINTCDRHKMSNYEQPRGTFASSFSLPPLLRHQGYFISFIDMHSQLGEQVSRTIVLNDLAPGECE
jgi:hypothetical protein